MKPALTHNQINIITNLKTAWQYAKGTQWAMWLTLVVWILISALILFLGWFGLRYFPQISYTTSSFIVTLFIIVFTAPLFAGMNMAAIRRVRGETLPLTAGLQYFRQWAPLGIGFLCIVLITALMTSLFEILVSLIVVHAISATIIAAVFSSLIFTLVYTFLAFTLPFIADKSMSPWRAILQSFLVVRTTWLPLFGLMVIFYLLDLINLLIAQIPYAGVFIYIIISLWLIPFIFLNIAVAYHQLVNKTEKENNENTLLSPN